MKCSGGPLSPNYSWFAGCGSPCISRVLSSMMPGSASIFSLSFNQSSTSFRVNSDILYRPKKVLAMK